MTGRSILVTGASRGIGRALAIRWAGPGTRLALLGRDASALDETAAACRAAGAETAIIAADIRDRDQMARTLAELDTRAPLDLAVANAGIAAPTGDDDTVARSSYDEIDVNLAGGLNTVLPLVPRMSARGRGQIALVSSLAAWAPLAESPGYSASKAALLVYGLALRERLRDRGVRVNVVCPGYIATDMGSRYKGWRPLEMSPERAASHIDAGLSRDKAVIAFPFPLALVAKLSTFVPEPVMRLGLKGFQFKIDRQG